MTGVDKAVVEKSTYESFTLDHPRQRKEADQRRFQKGRQLAEKF